MFTTVSQATLSPRIFRQTDSSGRPVRILKAANALNNSVSNRLQGSRRKVSLLAQGRKHLICRAGEGDGTDKESSNDTTVSKLDALLGIEPEEEELPTPAAPPTPPPAPSPPPTPEERRKAAEPVVDYSERSIASLCYLLPLVDSVKYARFLLLQFPLLSIPLIPLKPVYDAYSSLGFFSIIVFFAIYFGVGQNQAMPRFVRYSAMQAIILDILLILPDVLLQMFNGIDGTAPTSGLGYEAQVLLSNTVFIFVYACAVYASIECWRGKEPKLPLVSSAADNQTNRM